MARTIAMMIGGKWQDGDKPNNPNSNNFLVVCERGDWSGFMSLSAAKAKEESLAKMGRPDGYFWIEER